MSLRIMHISTRLILGGSQENTVLSCEGQVALGHDVALVYGPIGGPEGSMLDHVRAFRTSDGRCIETIETPHLVREVSPLRDRRCYHDLRKIIRDWKPDVVHTHSSKAGILGRSAAWKNGTAAVIHTIHGLPFHPYEKPWRNAMYIRAERYAAKRCHRIVCVAKAMRNQALAAGIGHAEQYSTVYSGMEIDIYRNPNWSRDDVRAELGMNKSDTVFGTVARLFEHKGHDDLLDALAPVMRSRPDLKLLWVGDGTWRGRLESRIHELGLEDQVILTGLVPPEDVPKYLVAMEVLCHPSYREGLPRTVPQALLSETPVIAYDVDGTKEVCIDHETGLLVKPGDIEGLRRAVEWMLDHPSDRAKQAARGRELCESRFAASTMVDELEKVYSDVLFATQST